MTNLSYTINKANNEDILFHLRNCDEYFTPPLSSKVDLTSYSTKLFHQAISFEAWKKDILVGMLNAYFNDLNNRTIFITNVSVLNQFRQMGVASALIQMCLNLSSIQNINRIRLEVSTENYPAIKLYEKFGFTTIKKSDENLQMELKISSSEKGDYFMQKLRDYNQEIQDTPDHKYAYNFDYEVMHPFMIRSFKPFFKLGNCLELGSYKGIFTQKLIHYFDDLTCVEASGDAINDAKKLLGERVKFIHALFENANLSKKYDNIILTHVLEHLDNPIGLLKRINDEWLSEKGRLFLVCPNANSPSRQIAVKMGLISHNSAITEAETEHGHKITYSLDTLERDARSGGLKIIHRSGIFFKALANFQWDRLLESDIISKEYLEGCYQLGQQYPDLCSSIYLVCERGNDKTIS